MEGTFDCPKCHAPNLKGALECNVCGIVFAKFTSKQSEAQEIEKHHTNRAKTATSQDHPKPSITPPVQKVGHARLQELWDKVMADYDNQDLHENFVNEAIKTNGLAFASQQYRNILTSNPQEAIAQKMQTRITGLAVSIFTPEHEDVDERFHFGFSGMMVVIGGMMMVSSFVLSDLLVKMTGGIAFFEVIGAVMVVVGIMIRVFMRKKE